VLSATGGTGRVLWWLVVLGVDGAAGAGYLWRDTLLGAGAAEAPEPQCCMSVLTGACRLGVTLGAPLGKLPLGVLWGGSLRTLWGVLWGSLEVLWGC
jgi:hypothetical protein